MDQEDDPFFDDAEFPLFSHLFRGKKKKNYKKSCGIPQNVWILNFFFKFLLKFLNAFYYGYKILP